MFVIFRCSCGRYLYAHRDTKIRTCPCGKRILLRKTRLLANTNDALKAGEIVRSMQMGGRSCIGFSPAKL